MIIKKMFMLSGGGHTMLERPQAACFKLTTLEALNLWKIHHTDYLCIGNISA